MDHQRDSEKMRILAPVNPRPRLLGSVINIGPLPVAEKVSEPEKSGHSGRFVFYFAVVIVAAALAAMGIKHYAHEEIATPAFARPIAVIKTIRQNLPAPPATPMPVAAETLHVTSTALGDVPIAIVNGKRLEEGDWLEVRTPNGVAALRVAKIEDDIVHFGYAGNTIQARISSGPGLKKLTP